MGATGGSAVAGGTATRRENKGAQMTLSLRRGSSRNTAAGDQGGSVERLLSESPRSVDAKRMGRATTRMALPRRRGSSGRTRRPAPRGVLLPAVPTGVPAAREEGRAGRAMAGGERAHTHLLY